MVRKYSLPTALVLIALIGAAPAGAQSIPAYVAAAVNDPGRPAADTARDADRKPAESVTFAGIKPGDTVLELLAAGGYYTRILSKVVGPKGHIYATMPTALVAAQPHIADVPAATHHAGGRKAAHLVRR